MHAPQLPCRHSEQTLALDALRAAGHAVELDAPHDPRDRLRAALAARHAPLVRDVEPGDVAAAVAIIHGVAPVTIAQARADVHAEDARVAGME